MSSWDWKLESTTHFRLVSLSCIAVHCGEVFDFKDLHIYGPNCDLNLLAGISQGGGYKI